MDRKSVTHHLKEWDDREAITAAEQVKALLNTPGWEYVLEGLRLYERTHVAAQIASPKEHAEYAHAAGHIKGLREVEGIAKGIVEHGAEVEARLRERQGVTSG